MMEKSMSNDLISRSALLADYACKCGGECAICRYETDTGDCRVLLDTPAVDAEVVRHEGNTTFVTTDNLDDYADRIIVRQGNWCKVYYRDSDDAEVEGC